MGLNYVLKYENTDPESISNPGVRSLGFIRLELVFREYYIHGIGSDYYYQIYEVV